MSAKKVTLVAFLGLLLVLVWSAVAWASPALGNGGKHSGGNSPGPVGAQPEGSVPLTTPVACDMPFTDVHTYDYFYNDVRNLYCLGAISGYSDNTFRPGNQITWAQMAKIEVLAFSIPIWTPPSPQPPICGVPPDHPFYLYIASLEYHLQGGPPMNCDIANPYHYVTRRELVRQSVGLTCLTAQNPSSPPFTDILPTDPDYPYIVTAYSYGIISGYADGTFRPMNPVNRGQAAKIINRTLAEGSSCPSTTPTPGLQSAHQ